MRTWKLALACLLAFSVFVGIAFLPGTQAKVLKAGVIIEPHRVDLGSQMPPEVTAIIKIVGAYDVTQIDSSTILMEGYLPPLWTEIRILITDEGEEELRLVAGFDGNGVEAILWAKIYHLGITTPNPNAPAKIGLDVTGNLLPEYGGTAFAGTGDLKVIIPVNNPPPPP